MERLPLESTVLESVGYDPQRRILEVGFRSGIAYRYFSVPRHVFVELLSAASHGRYFNSRIRNRFTFERMIEK